MFGKLASYHRNGEEMSNYLKVLALGAALLALIGIGSVTGRSVFAQDSSATPTATAEDDSGATKSDDAKPDKEMGPGKHSRRGGHGHGFGGGHHVDAEAVATFLGITEDELKSELRDGSSLAAIAEAHGKSRDELKTFLIEQYTAGLDAIIDAVPGDRSDADDSATPEAESTPAAMTGVLA
jgi:hypothetical protein